MGYEERVQELTKANILSSDARVLAALSPHGKDFTIKELCSITARSQAVVNLALRRLIRKGYVVTRSIPRDTSGRPKSAYTRIVSDEFLDNLIREATEEVLEAQATAEDLEMLGLRGSEARVLEFMLTIPKNRRVQSVELTKALGITQATISEAMRRLKEFRWIKSSQYGYQRLKTFDQIKSESLARQGIHV